jgi:CBS domain-containing protein
MKKQQAKDIMNANVICAKANMDIRELAKLLTDEKISGAPVVDDNDNLVGVVSLLDLVRQGLETDQPVFLESDFYRQLPQDISFKKGFHIEDLNIVRVSEIMTPVLITASDSSTEGELASIMVEKHIHRIIITQGKKVAGIVTTMDLLKLLANSR